MNLLEILKKEKDAKISGGIYNKLQIEFTYHSNRIEEKGYLIDTCLTAQDKFKKYLDYFRIEY